MARPPLTPDGYDRSATAVLEFAQEAARALGHRLVDQPHLVLGLLRYRGVASEVLRAAGFSTRRVRSAAARWYDRRGEAGQIQARVGTRAVVLGASVAEVLAVATGVGAGRRRASESDILFALIRVNAAASDGGFLGGALDGDLEALRRDLALRLAQPIASSSSKAPAEPTAAPESVPTDPSFEDGVEDQKAKRKKPIQPPPVEPPPVDPPAQPEPPASDELPLMLEAVPTHADRPATVDQLNRRRLAEVLAERIRRVWGEDTEVRPGSRREQRRRHREDRGRAREAGSFMVHLHAPWGAGKSSLLNFLADELRNRKPLPGPGAIARLSAFLFARRRAGAEAALSQWIVVQFSAWEHQRLATPWWWLLAELRRSAARELWLIDRRVWLWFWLRDVAWRARNARQAWISLLIVSAAVGVSARFDWFGLDGASLAEVAAAAGAIGTVLAVGATAWGHVRGTSRLLVGSSEGTAKFLKRAHDPLGVYQRRFRQVVRSARRPIAIFIDDLDRCRPDYVVRLLEGIQTVFAREPIAYVVAADRAWLCDSFASEYATFDAGVGDAGRPLGFLFLEKTFQVSVEIPPMSVSSHQRFWGSLTGGEPNPSPADGAHDATDEDVQGKFAEASTIDEVHATLDQLIGGQEDYDQVARAAVRRLNSDELRLQLEGLLRGFEDRIERNPRAMKRLLNAYGVECDMLVRDGLRPTSQQQRQLALLAILRLRWPLLAEHLLECPNDADLCAYGASPPDEHPFGSLMQDAAVRELFSGEPRLDREALERYVQRDYGPAAVGSGASGEPT